MTDELVEILSAAKVHLLVAVQTRPGSEERTEQLGRCHRLTSHARRHVDQVLGGIMKLPLPLAVALRVCEKGLEKLGGPQAPPVDGQRGAP